MRTILSSTLITTFTFSFITVMAVVMIERTNGNVVPELLNKKDDGTIGTKTPQAFLGTTTDDDDPICSNILDGSIEEYKKETQRGKLTINILQCILKELKSESFLERKYLPKNYNKMEIPVSDPDSDWMDRRFPNGSIQLPKEPINVGFHLDLHEVLDLSDSEHYLTFDLEMHTFWTDWKIHEHLTKQNTVDREVGLSGDFLDKIWTPDIIFEQIASVSNPNVGVEPKSILLYYPEGMIQLKKKMILNLYCDLDFTYYPADTQVCKFTVGSYLYNPEFVNITWWNKGVYLHRIYDYNFQYQVISTGKKYENTQVGSTIYNESTDLKRGYLEFVVKARRKLSYHLIQTYVPSVLLAVVTWLCFLVPREQSEVRVGVAMTILLTTTGMFSSVRANAPAVNYVKAIDIWMLGCIFFIFGILAGFLAIAWIQKYEKSRKINHRTIHQVGLDTKEFTRLPHIAIFPTNEFRPLHPQLKRDNPPSPKSNYYFESSELGSLVPTDSSRESCCKPDEKLDKILVIFMPSSFAIFVITYWIWLVFGSDYHNWSLNEEHNRIHA